MGHAVAHCTLGRKEAQANTHTQNFMFNFFLVCLKVSVLFHQVIVWTSLALRVLRVDILITHGEFLDQSLWRWLSSRKCLVHFAVSCGVR